MKASTATTQPTGSTPECAAPTVEEPVSAGVLLPHPQSPQPSRPPIAGRA